MLYTHEGFPTHIKKAPSQASVDMSNFKDVLKKAAKSPSRDNDMDSMFSDSSSSTSSDTGLSMPEESSEIFEEVDEKTKLMFKVLLFCHLVFFLFCFCCCCFVERLCK